MNKLSQISGPVERPARSAALGADSQKAFPPRPRRNLRALCPRRAGRGLAGGAGSPQHDPTVNLVFLEWVVRTF